MGDKNKKDWNERDALCGQYQYARFDIALHDQHQVDEKQNVAGSCTWGITCLSSSQKLSLEIEKDGCR
jgi:hypothetical protein